MVAEPIIDVRDLIYTYPKAAAPAVASISFQIPRGEIFGFLGPNGAGKSTTQKVLIGLLRDYEGSVSVFGRDLRQWDDDYYERLGVSFEFPNHHLKLTALENLTCFRALYAGDTEDPSHLLDLVGLGADADKRRASSRRGCVVGSTWPAPCSRNRTCCFWMSRRPGSTRCRAARFVI